jgi:hypothetical protein
VYALEGLVSDCWRKQDACQYICQDCRLATEILSPQDCSKVEEARIDLVGASTEVQ